MNLIVLSRKNIGSEEKRGRDGDRKKEEGKDRFFFYLGSYIIICIYTFKMKTYSPASLILD